MKDAIQQGDLGRYLIKPVHFWLITLISDLSKRIMRLMLGSPVFILLFTLTRAEFNFSGPIFLYLLIIVVSFLLAFSLSYSFGLLTFWIEELWGLQNLKENVVVLLGGIALPYVFFPSFINNLLKWTPFPYLIVWPLRPGFTGSIGLELAVATLWTVFFIMAGFILWKKGLKIYSGVGLY